ncbi:MAG: flagellar basal-body rod protein FlgG [Pirellulaceae bacterium]
MLKAFYSSATGMRAQEQLIDNTANNLANVNTTGFKRKHIHFADLIYETMRNPGASTQAGAIAPEGLQIGNGTRAIGNASINTNGVPIETGQDTHMAIEGDGYFQVLDANGGFLYTRDGSFLPDANGQLVTAEGYPVQPGIQIPQGATKVSITEDGQVSAEVDGVVSALGVVTLARFPNDEGLKNVGSNFLQQTQASGAAILGTPTQQGFGKVRQRFLEGSNVEVVTELVNLITAQRAYEINSRAIRAGDEMLSNTGQLVR